MSETFPCFEAQNDVVDHGTRRGRLAGADLVSPLQSDKPPPGPRPGVSGGAGAAGAMGAGATGACANAGPAHRADKRITF
jgi:hypothetical protein